MLFMTKPRVEILFHALCENVLRYYDFLFSTVLKIEKGDSLYKFILFLLNKIIYIGSDIQILPNNYTTNGRMVLFITVLISMANIDRFFLLNDHSSIIFKS